MEINNRIGLRKLLELIRPPLTFQFQVGRTLISDPAAPIALLSASVTPQKLAPEHLTAPTCRLIFTSIFVPEALNTRRGLNDTTHDTHVSLL